MKQIAIFASGEGSNYRAIHQHILNGKIPGAIVLVVSNNSNCGAVQFTSENGIESLIINESRFPNQVIRENLLWQALLKSKIDLICLAGYMKMIPEKIVKEFEKRILNIHPALLPDFGGKGFYGKKVHDAVINSGAKESGATVHFVDEEYDHGPVIAHKKIEIRTEDTPEILAKRVLEIEHSLYPEVVKAFCEDRIIWKNNRPKIEVAIEN